MISRPRTYAEHTCRFQPYLVDVTFKAEFKLLLFFHNYWIARQILHDLTHMITISAPQTNRFTKSVQTPSVCGFEWKWRNEILSRVKTVHLILENNLAFVNMTICTVGVCQAAPFFHFSGSREYSCLVYGSTCFIITLLLVVCLPSISSRHSLT